MNQVYLSYRANPLLTNELRKKGYEVILIKDTPYVHPAIASHPDLYMCKMGVGQNAPIFLGKPELLTSKYPGDIRYNAVCLDDYFIHNLSYTDPALLSAAKEKGLTPVHVKQGYTKCSCVVVDGSAIITADEGIYKSLQSLPIQILLVEKGHVELPGFPYGFLGGASGRIGGELLFHGNLQAHPDFQKMKEFVEARALRLTFFKSFPLSDIGSFFTD